MTIGSALWGQLWISAALGAGVAVGREYPRLIPFVVFIVHYFGSSALNIAAIKMGWLP